MIDSPPANYFQSDYKESKKCFGVKTKILLATGGIPFSRKDKKKGIVLPTQLTPELCYLIGAHIGDGSMNIHHRHWQVEYKWSLSGHLINDVDWHMDVLIPLFKSLFNFEPKHRIDKRANGTVSHVLYFDSKAVVNYLHDCIGLPLGKKSATIDIPEIILNAGLGYTLPCIRGIFDTDFCFVFKTQNKVFHHYPKIELKVSSAPLVNRISSILNEINISNFLSKEKIVVDKRSGFAVKRYEVTVSGKKNIDEWFELIGSQNPSYFSRYLIWKRFGFYPPHTNYDQRKAILSGKLDPFSFYNKNGQGEI